MKKMKRIKKIAWILSFCMLFSLFNVGDLSKVEAAETSTGGYLLAYTRSSESRTDIYTPTMPTTQERVKKSVHLAYSTDGVNYTSLNSNTGVLFAKADYQEDTAEIAGVVKTLKDPFIFRMADGNFGLLAVRSNDTGGDDSANKGKVLLYTSKDLIDFEEQGYLTLNSNSVVVHTPQCTYNAAANLYTISWKDESENVFVNTTSNFTDISEPESGTMLEDIPANYQIVDDSYTDGTLVDGVVSSEIEVTGMELDKIVKKFAKITNTGVEAITAETTTRDPVKYKDLPKAVATYSDGSTANYNVNWSKEDYNKIDFTKAGTYTIEGTIAQADYSNFKINNFADPIAVYSEDTQKYYFMGTNGTDDNYTLYIRESDTLDGLVTAAAEPVKGQYGYSYELGVGTGTTRCLLWAPELHKIGDYWYCLFASGGTSWDRQCAYMMRNTTGDLGDPEAWEDAVLVKGKDGVSDLYAKGLTIDMTYFEVNAKHYIVWAQRETLAKGGSGVGNSDLWIATIDPENPTVVTSEPMMLSQAEYGWEKRTTNVIEGAFSIQKDGKIYITYSGSGVDATYCVGYLEADITGDNDLLDPASWKKSAYPILTWDNNGEKGPGHSAFTIDEFGNEIFIYHFFDDGYNKRSARTRKLHWAADGTPVLNMSKDDELSALQGDLSVTARITVKASVSGISLDKTSVSITKGSSAQLTAAIQPSDAENKEVSWKSSNTSVATVSASGLVKGVKNGTATITVTTADGGYKAECKVTVMVPATKVTVGVSKKTLNVGKSLNATCKVLPADTTDKVKWSSSNSKIAAVNQTTGKITAKKAGKVTITAKAGNKSDSVTLTIKAPVKSLKMKKAKVTLTNGATKKLGYTVFPKNTTDTLTWKSSNTKVVKVVNKKNGKIKAVGTGKARVTVKASSGKKAICTVTVK